MYLVLSMKSIAYLLFLFVSISFSQEAVFTSKTPLDADKFIGKDAYNNTYYSKDMVLHKDGPDGNFVFNDFQLGPIHSVDFINPLKIIVFYRDVNTVVFLDNKLTEINRVNFSMTPDFITLAGATNAADNRLWLFNSDSQQLEIYNYKSHTKLLNSQPFSGSLLAQESTFNYCLVLTEATFQIFNIYGSLLYESSNNSISKLTLFGKKIIALVENKLEIIEDITVSPTFVPLALKSPEISIKELQLSQDFLYIYDGEFLHTFTLTQPK